MTSGTIFSFETFGVPNRRCREQPALFPFPVLPGLIFPLFLGEQGNSFATAGLARHTVLFRRPDHTLSFPQGGCAVCPALMSLVAASPCWMVFCCFMTVGLGLFFPCAWETLGGCLFLWDAAGETPFPCVLFLGVLFGLGGGVCSVGWGGVGTLTARAPCSSCYMIFFFMYKSSFFGRVTF